MLSERSEAERDRPAELGAAARLGAPSDADCAGGIAIAIPAPGPGKEDVADCWAGSWRSSSEGVFLLTRFLRSLSFPVLRSISVLDYPRCTVCDLPELTAESLVSSTAGAS